MNYGLGCNNTLLKVPVLVTPLGCDSEGILDKSDHNEETTNCRKMRFQGLRVDIDHIFDFGGICPNLLDGIVWIGWRGRLVRWGPGSEAVRIISVRWAIGVSGRISWTGNIYS